MTIDRDTGLAILKRLEQLDFWANEFESLVRLDRPVNDVQIQIIQAKARSLMGKMREQALVSDYAQYYPLAEQYCSYGRELYGKVWDAAHAEDRRFDAALLSDTNRKNASKLRAPVIIEDINNFQDEYIKTHGRLKKGWKKAACKELRIGIDALNERLKKNKGSSHG